MALTAMSGTIIQMFLGYLQRNESNFIQIFITGHHDDEDGGRGARYLRNPAIMPTPGYHHPHEQVYTDPMENADFERYQQRPVDLGNYNRQSYSPNSAHTVAAVAAAEGWTHLAGNPDWVDARAGHNAAAVGLPWPPHRSLGEYLRIDNF